MSAQDESGLRAQRGKDPGQLDSDVAAAHYGDPLGPGLELEEFIGGNAQLRTRNVRQHGTATHGDEDMRCGQLSAPSLDSTSVQEACAAVDHFYWRLARLLS